MNVLQHTRNERNLFFKRDRADRFYRDCLLTVKISYSLHHHKNSDQAIMFFERIQVIFHLQSRGAGRSTLTVGRIDSICGGADRLNM